MSIAYITSLGHRRVKKKTSHYIARVVFFASSLPPLFRSIILGIIGKEKRVKTKTNRGQKINVKSTRTLQNQQPETRSDPISPIYLAICLTSSVTPLEQ
jgi:hypothetical protein